MAGSHEADNVEGVDVVAIKRQLDEFEFRSSESEEDGSDLETSKGDAPMSKTAPARKRKLEEDSDPCRDLVRECAEVKISIQGVEADIQTLEKKIQQLQGIDRLAALPSRFSGKASKKKKRSDCQEEISFLKQCISLTMEYTSVSISTSKWKTVYIDGNTICRKHLLSGTVGDTPFMMEYKLLEPFGPRDDNAAAPTIFAVALEVPEDVPDDFTRILQKVVSQNDIQGVMHALTSYLTWRQEFCQTVEELQRLHPHAVTMETVGDNECLILSSTDDDKNLRGRVMVRWELSTSPTCSIQTVPRLALQLPQSMLDLDKDQTVQGFVDNFPQLQKKIGLRKSLEYLISLVKEI